MLVFLKDSMDLQFEKKGLKEDFNLRLEFLLVAYYGLNC